ncbi:hypothetical protein DelCs14_1778 [Delftia sp. Cs1-4]|uniref:hypothetical protein n=1 Tax=Delftia sp. (strain Cs1-4) TaxID=742013 RepID=UPI00020E7BD5|nr:hypothetical protein [Delftia sp. Cs1-4]AEF88804.1 hypothetical protein DelCs14_1778 [Delftia sp. Cs1-4]
MPNITEILCAIERRAERAIVQELRLMTQEILAMRTQLSLEHRAHADALLLKLDHLERCQQVDTETPAATVPHGAPPLPVLPLDTLTAVQPSHYLVHFYSHDVGDLERVVLTKTLAAAVQLVRLQVAVGPRPVLQVSHDAGDGEVAFLAGDDMVLASIVPCEPGTPDLEPEVAAACAALASGDLSALRQLFVGAPALRHALLAA